MKTKVKKVVEVKNEETTQTDRPILSYKEICDLPLEQQEAEFERAEKHLIEQAMQKTSPSGSDFIQRLDQVALEIYKANVNGETVNLKNLYYGIGCNTFNAKGVKKKYTVNAFKRTFGGTLKTFEKNRLQNVETGKRTEIETIRYFDNINQTLKDNAILKTALKEFHNKEIKLHITEVEVNDKSKAKSDFNTAISFAVRPQSLPIFKAWLLSRNVTEQMLENGFSN